MHYTEGQQSLNWAKIMRTINEDINGFFEQGGWKFLEEDAVCSCFCYAPSKSKRRYSRMRKRNQTKRRRGMYTCRARVKAARRRAVGSTCSVACYHFLSLLLGEEEENFSSESEGSDTVELGDSEESGKDWSDLEEEAKRGACNRRHIS